MYIITILDTKTNRKWDETYENYELYLKRVKKLRYSRKLLILRTIEDEL